MAERTVLTSGAPVFTASGREIHAFHLHRFLAAWMAQQRVDVVYVALGFLGSSMPCGLVEVRPSHAAFVERPWGFDDAFAAWKQGGHWLNVEGESSLAIVALTEPTHGGGSGGGSLPLGFAMVSSELNTSQLEELRTHTTSAIQSCRRNAVRMFFDETPSHDIKAFLYGMLDHLPEWTGVDGSAAVILSNSLDAMRLSSADASFFVMAERLFVANDDRLVGMALTAEAGTLLGAALEGQRDSGRRVFHRFKRREDGSWEGGRIRHDAFHVAGRDEQMMMLVPLVAVEGDEREHLGWLTLSWREAVELPSSTVECLAVLAERLASGLRRSPLYTMSARKMWILKAVRGACERAIAGCGTPDERRSQLEHDVTELVRVHAGVPSFSLGHVGEVEGRRVLRFEVSFGWTDFSSIELPVDVDDVGMADSGVSTLVVRLKRPMVLAGRHGAAGFKNYLWVNEGTCELVDTRTPEGSEALKDGAGWQRLSAYYKPAREQAYGTLAYPVMFDGVVLGVIAVEVDRETPWYWWSGYGGLAFWELMAGDLAFAFHALGVCDTRMDA